jgi:hypothetical protein
MTTPTPTPTLKLARLPAGVAIVDKNGLPTPYFKRLWDQQCTSIETVVNAQGGLIDAITAANAAADAANTAAAAANDTAQQVGADAALTNSYISPDSVLTCSTTTITIAAHTRHYADGSSVAVNGGSVACSTATDIDYVYYNDSSMAGGAVAYLMSVGTQPAQVGGVHVVGAVTVPAVGTTPGGKGPLLPGYVEA